jgi:hypothetical protein
VQRSAADTQRAGKVLIGAGAVAIQGNGEAVNPQLSHACPFCLSEFSS